MDANGNMAGDVALSIVIVNWKSADFLRKCLQSIFANAGDLSLEVIVVDNASFDGSAELVEREFPGVHFVQSKENLGFAGANNLGVRSANGRNLLFLNPDTEVIGTALERMSSFLDATPNAGAVGCKLLNTDGTVQTSCIQPFPTILNQALDTEFLRKMFPKSRLWGMEPLLGDPQGPSEVEMISGACLLIRRHVFEQVGCFDTKYFMYTEDVDLCYKVWRAGWKNYYVSSATVTHHGGRSSSAKPESHFATVMQRKSKLKFFSCYRGAVYAFLYRITMGCIALLRLFIVGLVFLPTLGLLRRPVLTQILHKWTMVLRWAIGLEA